MRKIILSALALMIGAIGFAQNTGTVIQTGDNNAGIVDQTGSNNVGTILTIGNLHNDQATFYGNWTSGAAGVMLAKGVTQIGAWNTGFINQASSVGATGGYPNDVNKAGIGQEGNYNNAQINQFDATVHSWNAQNVAFVDQLGDANISLQNQLGRASQSYFRQEGSNNKSSKIDIE